MNKWRQEELQSYNESFNGKLERCPELTQDVPREEVTGQTHKGLFILVEEE